MLGTQKFLFISRNPFLFNQIGLSCIMKFPSLELIPSPYGPLFALLVNFPVRVTHCSRAGYWSFSIIFNAEGVQETTIIFCLIINCIWKAKLKYWLQFAHYSTSWGLVLTFPHHIWIFGLDMVIVKLLVTLVYCPPVFFNQSKLIFKKKLWLYAAHFLPIPVTVMNQYGTGHFLAPLLSPRCMYGISACQVWSCQSLD